MVPPQYLSIYTLKDFIAEEVIKAQSSNEMSTPPSQKDFIRAAKKVSMMTKSSFPLSVNALLFHPEKTSSISVTSLLSSSPPLLVPVQLVSGRSELSLSTLQLLFPQATGLHYTSGDQLVTLARFSSYKVTQGKVELSHQVFCIPFLGTEVIYVVTDEKEVVSLAEGGSVLDGIVEFVRNIQTGMIQSLTELEKMESLTRQLQVLIKENAVDQTRPEASQDSILGTSNLRVEDLGDKGLALSKVKKAYENVSNHVKNISEQYREEVPSDSNISGCVIGLVVSVKDENVISVDDYGFSDTEDVSDDVIHAVDSKSKNVKVMESVNYCSPTNENPSDIKNLKNNSSSSATGRSFIQVSVKKCEEVSSSTRPKCVRRILPSKPLVSLLSSGPISLQA